MKFLQEGWGNPGERFPGIFAVDKSPAGDASLDDCDQGKRATAGFHSERSSFMPLAAHETEGHEKQQQGTGKEEKAWDEQI